MTRARQTARSFSRRAVAAGAALALLATPAIAAGASLKIKVSPSRVRPGQNYVIKVAGQFTASEVNRTAYLWEFLQFSASSCQPSGQAESTLPHSILSPDFAGTERGSPFVRTDTWKAGTLTGLRHVCAYLYPHKVSARSKVQPIAKADARYRDV